MSVSCKWYMHIYDYYSHIFPDTQAPHYNIHYEL